jgi:TRAP transporter TAXI family solute receptor
MQVVLYNSKNATGMTAMALFKLMVVSAMWLALSLAPTTAAETRERTIVTLGTATPGGGFQLFGGVVAPVVNETDPTLMVVPMGTKGSRQNLPLLQAGKLDTALVAGVPAYEALTGVNGEKVDLKIISAIYPSFGAFAVRGDSPAQTFDDLIGEPVAWGTRASGLTALSGYVTTALGLDRDQDFQAVYLERAGFGAPMVLEGEVAALWGGGVGWPNFTDIMTGGGRMVGLTPQQVETVHESFPFLKPYTLPPESYPGQTEPLPSVAIWSFILARPDLPDDVAYRLAKALHQGNEALAAELAQGRETTPENTRLGAFDLTLIHPGVRKYHAEIGM